MNQRGEVTLISTLLVLTLMSLVLLCSLELRKSFKLLERRTELFLCTKEAKGELSVFLKFMGRSNWAIKNINKASLVMMFIPGLQSAALKADKAKKIIKKAQGFKLITYLNTLALLKKKGCPLDPQMFLTPYRIRAGLQRDSEGAAILRKDIWTYYFFSNPYLLTLDVNAKGHESVKPIITYKAEEKGAKLSSLLSSR